MATTFETSPFLLFFMIASLLLTLGLSHSHDSSSDDSDGDMVNITLGMYNTYQVSTAPSLDERKALQLKEFASTYADMDILCLNELFFLTEKQEYMSNLSSLYPYNASKINYWVSEGESYKLDLPRVPCNNQSNSDAVISAVNSDCFSTTCGAYYEVDLDTFVFCVLSQCFAEYYTAVYSECLWCVASIRDLLPGSDLDITYANALFVCNNQELDFNFELMESSLILSKYPIVNRYYFDGLPSNLVTWEMGLNVAEIEVDGLDDNLFVACSHYQSVSSNSQIVSLDANLTVVGLNEQQVMASIELIRNNISTLTDNNVFVWMGDFNVGKLGRNPDIFDLVLNDNFTDMTDLEYINEDNAYGLNCTWCKNESLSNYNILAGIGDADEYYDDLDHILVKNDEMYYKVYGISGERIFLQEYDVDAIVDDTDGEINDTMIPLSDHYGLKLELMIVEVDDGDDDDDDGATRFGGGLWICLFAFYASSVLFW